MYDNIDRWCRRRVQPWTFSPQKTVQGSAEITMARKDSRVDSTHLLLPAGRHDCAQFAAGRK